MRWDPLRYRQFADERGRPFVDLLGRVGHAAPRRVVDLGCGPGELTARLAQRWPSAAVEGIDSSPEMVDSAAAYAGERVSFRVSDVASWQPPTDADVVVANAVLQWVPGHQDLLRRWLVDLPSGAWIAVQVPDNFTSPSHTLMRALATSPRWAPQLGDVLRHHDSVSSPAEYASLLLDNGWRPDVWETTYLHLLIGPDPVLDWVRGTGLRPVLAALSEADAREFVATYGEQLREAYPPTPHGTLFPFRRIFVVGSKP